MVAPSNLLKSKIAGNISVNKRFVSIAFNNGDYFNLSRSGLGKNIIQIACFQYLKSKKIPINCPKCNGNMSVLEDLTGKDAFIFECPKCHHSISKRI